MRPISSASLGLFEFDIFSSHVSHAILTSHRHLPKAIYNAQKLKTVVKQAQDIKVQRVRAHSKPGSVPFVAERKKHILRELE